MIAATVLVIAKEPRPGYVKTRLCPPCTPAEAADLATAALHDTCATLARVPIRRRVAVLDGRPGAWLPGNFEVVEQASGPLEARLAAAFAHTKGPTVLVGMDTPQLTVPIISNALHALLRPGVDAVLGLAQDGGWWTIGLQHADPRVFAGIEMSTLLTGMFQQTRLQQLGLRTQLLPTQRDVDHWSDARAVAAGMPARSRFAATVRAVGFAIERRSLAPTA